MSRMKRYAEQVSANMGLGGEITDAVLVEADKRLAGGQKIADLPDAQLNALVGSPAVVDGVMRDMEGGAA